MRRLPPPKPSARPLSAELAAIEDDERRDEIFGHSGIRRATEKNAAQRTALRNRTKTKGEQQTNLINSLRGILPRELLRH